MQNTMSLQKSVLSITMSGSVTYFILSIRPLYFRNIVPNARASLEMSDYSRKITGYEEYTKEAIQAAID